MIEGSGSGFIPLTDGSGSGSKRPKNMWIRWIRIRNTGFLLASWSSMMKIEGSGFASGSGSISQRPGSGSTPKCHGSATLVDPWHFGPDPQIRTTDLRIRIYVRIRLLNIASLKCQDLIKNIQMAYNFVTLLIYPLKFFFRGCLISS